MMASANIRNVIHINPNFNNSIRLPSSNSGDSRNSAGPFLAATHFNPLFLQQQQQEQKQRDHHLYQENFILYNHQHQQDQQQQQQIIQEHNINSLKIVRKRASNNSEQIPVKNIHMNPNFLLNSSQLSFQQKFQVVPENILQTNSISPKALSVLKISQNSFINYVTNDNGLRISNDENIPNHFKRQSVCYLFNSAAKQQHASKTTDINNIEPLRNSPPPTINNNNFYIRKTKTQLIRATDSRFNRMMNESAKPPTKNSNQIPISVANGNDVKKTYSPPSDATGIIRNGITTDSDTLHDTKSLASFESLSSTGIATLTAPNTLYHIKRNKYKIDRRTAIDEKIRNIIIERKAPRPTIVKPLKNNKLLVINGLLYKSTANSLKLKNALGLLRSATVVAKYNNRLSNTKFHLKKKRENKRKNELVIYVGGMRYIMDGDKRRLVRSNIQTNNRKIQKNVNNRLTNRGDLQQHDEDKLLSKLTQKGAVKSLDDLRRNNRQNLHLVRDYNPFRSGTSPYFVTQNNNGYLTRAYINYAKQRSLQMLMKRKNLVKSNITCPIYQSLGKCAAYERGKCNKSHNKLQVNICNKYLRGECNNHNCLLSHLVTLAKMPVCKFYLLGRCIRKDCLYLHKKLNSNAPLCPDFIRGYCVAAEKCDKRHELVCINNGRIGKCTKSNCYRCGNYQCKKDEKQAKEIDATAINQNKVLTEQNLEKVSIADKESVKEKRRKERYFLNAINNEDDSADTSDCVESYVLINRAAKLQAQPSYIPFQ